MSHGLHKVLLHPQKVFVENDVNNSGLMDSRDLRSSVNALGQSH